MTEYQVDDAELRERLTPEQYTVTQQAGTERAFTGKYWDTDEEGVYHCIVCDEPLFTSETKYDAGCGWPSFYQAIDDDKVTRKVDMTLGSSASRTSAPSAAPTLATSSPTVLSRPANGSA